jgi:predicted RNase H-related nuclease YkuK (DUF458 family)
MINNLLIRDMDKNIISYKDFVITIGKYNKQNYSFHVGSDSHQFFDKTSMVTSICFHHSLKGAGAFYIKEKVPRDRYPTLKSRITAEAFKSLEVAFLIQKMVSSKISVHLDIGSDIKKNKTSAFKKELTNLVIGQGFAVRIKPYSWASSSVADWFTKT